MARHLAYDGVRCSPTRLASRGFAQWMMGDVESVFAKLDSLGKN